MALSVMITLLTATNVVAQKGVIFDGNTIQPAIDGITHNGQGNLLVNATAVVDYIFIKGANVQNVNWSTFDPNIGHTSEVVLGQCTIAALGNEITFIENAEEPLNVLIKLEGTGREFKIGNRPGQKNHIRFLCNGSGWIALDDL